MKANILIDEEERLSIISSKGAQPIDIATNRHSLLSVLPISRHSSFNNNIVASMDRNSLGHDSMIRGSFYGRRDFENKHDDTADIVGSVSNNKLCRKTSTLDNVLTRIKSMRNSDHSDESENDDDEEDDEDDDGNQDS